MDIKVLARKGISEALEFLGEAEGNSALSDELRKKTGITHKKLGLLVEEGLLEKSDKRVVVKTVPIKRKRTTYSISDVGRRLLELHETLSEEEAKSLLKVSTRQLNVLRFFSKEGSKRPRDIPDIASQHIKRMADRGFLDKKVEEAEESRDVYRLRRTFTLSEKGRKICKALQTIKSV